MVRLNGKSFVLRRVVDSEGFELDFFSKKRKNKKAAIRFLSRLLGAHPAPRVIITDKRPSYSKPIRKMMPQSEHRRHKGLNNRVENAHQATRRKEKCLIKFKSPQGVQQVIHLMGKVRNIFSVPVGRYKNSAQEQRCQLNQAFNIWHDAERLLCA